MKTEITQHDMHIEALRWKATLQESEELLEVIEEKLNRAKLSFGARDSDDAFEVFFQTTSHYSEQRERFKLRISHFENKLSILNECDTSTCDTAFVEEAEAISEALKIFNINVKVLASEIGYYTDSKISD